MNSKVKQIKIINNSNDNINSNKLNTVVEAQDNNKNFLYDINSSSNYNSNKSFIYSPLSKSNKKLNKANFSENIDKENLFQLKNINPSSRHSLLSYNQSNESPSNTNKEIKKARVEIKHNTLIPNITKMSKNKLNLNQDDFNYNSQTIKLKKNLTISNNKSSREKKTTRSLSNKKRTINSNNKDYKDNNNNKTQSSYTQSSDSTEDIYKCLEYEDFYEEDPNYIKYTCIEDSSIIKARQNLYAMDKRNNLIKILHVIKDKGKNNEQKRSLLKSLDKSVLKELKQLNKNNIGMLRKELKNISRNTCENISELNNKRDSIIEDNSKNNVDSAMNANSINIDKNTITISPYTNLSSDLQAIDGKKYTTDHTGKPILITGVQYNEKNDLNLTFDFNNQYFYKLYKLGIKEENNNETSKNNISKDHKSAVQNKFSKNKPAFTKEQAVLFSNFLEYSSINTNIFENNDSNVDGIDITNNNRSNRSSRRQSLLLRDSASISKNNNNKFDPNSIGNKRLKYLYEKFMDYIGKNNIINNNNNNNSSNIINENETIIDINKISNSNINNKNSRALRNINSKNQNISGDLNNLNKTKTKLNKENKELQIIINSLEKNLLLSEREVKEDKSTDDKPNFRIKNLKNSEYCKEYEQKLNNKELDKEIEIENNVLVETRINNNPSITRAKGMSVFSNIGNSGNKTPNRNRKNTNAVSLISNNNSVNNGSNSGKDVKKRRNLFNKSSIYNNNNISLENENKYQNKQSLLINNNILTTNTSISNINNKPFCKEDLGGSLFPLFEPFPGVKLIENDKVKTKIGKSLSAYGKMSLRDYDNIKNGNDKDFLLEIVSEEYDDNKEFNRQINDNNKLEKSSVNKEDSDNREKDFLSGINNIESSSISNHLYSKISMYKKKVKEGNLKDEFNIKRIEVKNKPNNNYEDSNVRQYNNKLFKKNTLSVDNSKPNTINNTNDTKNIKKSDINIIENKQEENNNESLLFQDIFTSKNLGSFDVLNDKTSKFKKISNHKALLNNISNAMNVNILKNVRIHSNKPFINKSLNFANASKKNNIVSNNESSNINNINNINGSNYSNSINKMKILSKSMLFNNSISNRTRINEDEENPSDTLNRKIIKNANWGNKFIKSNNVDNKNDNDKGKNDKSNSYISHIKLPTSHYNNNSSINKNNVYNGSSHEYNRCIIKKEKEELINTHSRRNPYSNHKQRKFLYNYNDFYF